MLPMRLASVAAMPMLNQGRQYWLMLIFSNARYKLF